MKVFSSSRLDWRKHDKHFIIFDCLALAAMMAFVSAISYFILLNASLRLDEAQSLFQTNRNLNGLLKVVGQDVHVPLYHILLHAWQKLFGADIIIARLLSFGISSLALFR